MARNRTMLKVALLSSCIVSSATPAIMAIIPEMAKSFPDVELYVIELITTVPSLFQMLAILFSGVVVRFLGLKRSVMLGILLCGVMGVIPMVVQNFYVLLLTRCAYGIGCGLTMSSILTLIISFFEGPERSVMLGLQGSVLGLGNAASTLLVGQLQTLGWNWSFAIYALAFVVLALFGAFVPDTDAQNDDAVHENGTSEGATAAGLAFQGALMFLSALIISLFLVKAPTFVTERGLGPVQFGSFVLMLVSLGSLVGGALYGKVRGALGDYALVVFMLIAATGFAITAMSPFWAGVMVAALLIGYAMMSSSPHLQENVSLRFASFGSKGTNLILVTQALGAFAAPYLGTALGLVSGDMPTQFLVCAAGLGVLAVASGVYARAVR
jgi:MFS family permease